MAFHLGGYWQGVLITGPSGAGKSDLALGMLQAGCKLVADDRVLIWVSDGALYGRSPDPLAAHLRSGDRAFSRINPTAPSVALFLRCGMARVIGGLNQTK